ncbi:hypothetical protein COO60DRAFT_610651 [Scenedesmus sp. NREL 46B-D3]|nr:hypothetical protein COO60DRAFT_610651 [Scenedesmus sp. NREL 46B-D3]
MQEKGMVQQLCMWLLTLVALCLHGAAESRVVYDCPDSGFQSSRKCNQACLRDLGDALIGLYGGLSGSQEPLPWMDLQPGSMCLPCMSNNTKSGSPAVLPSYCCWPGVYCCSEDSGSIVEYQDPFGCWDDMPAAVHHLAMRGRNLAGSLSEPVMDSLTLLSEHGLHSIDLSSNAITGSIPRSIGRLKHMRSLNFNLNRLTGPIPEEISELVDLEHFYASFNSLSTPVGSTQPLAGRFCMHSATRLYSLILRANDFTGTVNVSHCEGLGLLDVQDNRFHGALPIAITNQNLISLRATNNLFNASIPEDLWRLPQLATLEMANNACAQLCTKRDAVAATGTSAD